jgi:hypothetical protein
MLRGGPNGQRHPACPNKWTRGFTISTLLQHIRKAASQSWLLELRISGAIAHNPKASDRSHELILRRELSCGLNILKLTSELPESF